jgi:flavin-dependent dehydrogenase
MSTPLPLRERYDVVVVGGGPAGTTCANLLTAHGHDVLLVEKARHPRFCIGESLLPATTPVWERLGLLDRFEGHGFVHKYGAYFCSAEGHNVEYFHFPDAAGGHIGHAWEVQRASFDKVLWDRAVEVGAHCVDECRVRGALLEGDRVVGVELEHGGEKQEVRARLVMDCTGRQTLLGKQLELRRPDPVLDKIALYTHYPDVVRSTGDDRGTIGIVATSFGWMWFIPFADGGASVGAVVGNRWFHERKKAGADAEAIWAEVLELVPHVVARIGGSTPSRPVEITANFQHRCQRICGDGWVMVGDAGAFVDPVFSSGVHLAVTGGSLAADAAHRALRGGRLPVAGDFRRYERKVRGALKVFTRFIHAWYDPYFRAVFMHPPHHRPGVNLLKREIIAVLAGEVFRPWRVLPAIDLLILLARLRRWGENRRGLSLPAPAA